MVLTKRKRRMVIGAQNNVALDVLIVALDILVVAGLIALALIVNW